ncbi:hypothetical protein B0J18DRAFT_434662 [Chaetomium sp. MPI-SDFR-AT-0129]|nr:hypothetical protein B0J18DRAFT_434662 [Chaetomium sp. MPI-SDFR-AT-0129]
MSIMSAPRKRRMPLVPEPFESVVISRQAVSLGNESTMAKTWARFCPNLNIPQYRETLSEEKKTELDQRATKLWRRAIRNHFQKSSEFRWEVCAWHDAFGLIMEDEGLWIDKRPYEYVEKDDSGQTTVKTRIPDGTLGLRAYDDYELKRGYRCDDPACKEDHSTKQPDQRLSEDRLRAMMHNPECALIVDGVWGKTDLVFPFAVYEAKKGASSYEIEAAESQIHHACQTYLAMLDDLARNPDNVAEYQTTESSKYQLFAFTSCGSYWEVYVAWKFLDDCFVETIWKGDLKQFLRAFDLICIIDQIQEYAAKHHREFVMKHLEAWHTRHEKSQDAKEHLPKALFTAGETIENMDLSDSDEVDSELDSSSGESDSSSNSFHFGDLVWQQALNSKPPMWLHLKEESKTTKQDRVRQTRERNRKLREELPRRQDLEGISLQGQGRPSKSQVAKNEAPKRRRGRPAKASSRATRVTKTAPPVTRRSTRTRTVTRGKT